MHGGFAEMGRHTRTRAEAPLIPASFPLGRAWFVVCVMAQQETAAGVDIEDLGFPVFCPMETRTRIRRGKRVKIEAPLLAGYLFASFDRERDEWGEIEHVDGVLGILKNGDFPVRVPDIQIERLKRAEEAGVFDLTKLSAFDPGEKVEIMEGPFAGLIARVKSATAKKRVKILLDALGAIEIDPTFLQKSA